MGRSSLRDQLKAGLSQARPEPGTEPVAQLAGRIKSLKSAHTIDAAPERTATRRIAAEEPVTARIRRRAESLPAVELPADPEPAATPVEMPPDATAAHRKEAPATNAAQALPAVIHTFPKAEPAVPAYRQYAARSWRKDAHQLSLF